MSEDWQPFAGIEKEEPSPKPIYHDKSSTPTMVSLWYYIYIYLFIYLYNELWLNVMMEVATILQQRYTIGVAPELLMLLLFLIKTYAVVVIDIPKINCVEESLLYNCKWIKFQL